MHQTSFHPLRRDTAHLALTLMQARLLIASLCGLHRVPVDPAQVTARLAPPIRLSQVMALLETLGIEARAPQPRRLVDALRPGALLQVGPMAPTGTGATSADGDGTPTPLLVSCESPGHCHDGRQTFAYAWVALAPQC